MVTGLWNHVESGRLAEFSVLPDPAFSRVSGRYSRACWSPERVLSGVFLDGARFFSLLVRLGFLRAGVACRASLAAHDLVCLGCRGCVLRDGCFWPVVEPREIWPFGRNLAVWPEFLCFGIRPVFVCFGRYSRACGSLERAPWGVLSDGVGVPGRRDRSCRSVFRPASAPLGFGLFPAPDASIRALRVLTPPSRMFRAALASALSVCPQLRHWKFAWLSRFFESPQMRVGSGGASSMPPQQRNSIEINAPGEWKP